MFIEEKKEENTFANANDMLGSSYIVTVDDYDTYDNPRLIDRATFSKHAFKNGRFSDSAQIDYDMYGTEFKIPQYPLDFLAGLLNVNIYHEECCDLVSMYTTKYGYEITINNELEFKEAEQLKQEVINWLEAMPINILNTINECAYDYEAIGCTGIELIQDHQGEGLTQYFKRLDIVNCKLTTDNKRVLQEVNGKRRYFLLYNNIENQQVENIAINKYTGVIGTTDTIPTNEQGNKVLWIRKYKTRMDSYGSSKISKAIDVIETEIGRSNFIKKFFVNYGLPAFIVTVTGNFKQYQQSKYKEDGTLNPDYDETKTLEWQIGQKLKTMILNPYSAMVLTLPSNSNFGNDVKVEITPLNNDVKEASFRLLREDNKKDICAAHGMSSDIIGTTQVGSLGGNTLETDLNSFIEDKIKPIQQMFVNSLNPVIRERFNSNNINYRLNNRKGEDKDKKLERVLKLGNAGLMTRHEQQAVLGNEYGITVDTENDYLDEYLINGRTEEQVFELGVSAYNRYYNNYNIADKTLNSIENDLMRTAYELWCKHGEDGTISLKSQTTEGLPASVRKIIKKHFKEYRNFNKQS